MGYPTTDFNPSARINGQPIDASHVNDLQNEVSAVVSALRGTITHSLTVSGAASVGTLQAGASTATSLNVTGALTVGSLAPSALSVSGGSTLATLQAAASTLASLVVSGGSTLATLSVSGGSTLAGNAVVGGTLGVTGVATFTGGIKFGTFTANIAGSVDGYMEVTDAAGNTRKLAVVN